MTNKFIAGALAYMAVGVQLLTYAANDAGWLGKGVFYWTLLYTSGITLLGTFIWWRRQRTRAR